MSRSHGWRTSGSPHSKTIAFIIVGAVTFGASCGTNPVTTWSAEARSSDSTWVATARNLQWSGPGNAYDGTSVEVKHARLPSTEVLFFSHQGPRMRLTMQWDTPTHLQVTYGPLPGDSVSLDYQVVKTGGIAISVQRLPNTSPR